MKKLILLVLILCSTASYSQGTIPIPQVIGLPAALAGKVDKVAGKSLIADTSIVKLTGVQASAQVNKLEGIQKNGVDLTITGKKVNITVPTTAAEIGAQTAGTYSTDIHGNISALNSVSNINTGDETLTSIKTKLGAATSVSDGYLTYQNFNSFAAKLSTETDPTIYSWAKAVTKPTYNYSEILSKPTLLSQFTNDLGNYGSFVTGTPWTSVGYWYSSSHPSTTSGYGLPDYPTTLPASDVYAWAKASTKPSYTYSEIGAAPSSTVSNATHTGDATGSTALTLATVNSNIGTFNNITINAKGLATAGSNVSYLTGITSGQVITALGYTPKPTFTENSGFNLPLGTTPGTVLEGRTFGTAANSAVGDFIQNQNSSAQSARMWINGSAKIDGGLALINRYDNSSKGSIIYNSGSGADFIFAESAPNIYTFGSGGYGSIVTPTLSLNISTRAATFASTVNSTGFLLNGNNLTSSLTTNYIPKWNGTNFVNATAGADYQRPITLTANGTSGAATKVGDVINIPNYSSASVNQTLTTVTGSTSGDIVGSMPFQTTNYKKVIVYVNFVSGNATYTFPTQFNTELNLHTNTLGASYSSVSVTGTSVTITGATNAAGVLIIEGY